MWLSASQVGTFLNEIITRVQAKLKEANKIDFVFICWLQKTVISALFIHMTLSQQDGT